MISETLEALDEARAKSGKSSGVGKWSRTRAGKTSRCPR